jgi:hypothetical protein
LSSYIENAPLICSFKSGLREFWAQADLKDLPIAKCLKCKTSANGKIENFIQKMRYFAALGLQSTATDRQVV